MKIAINYLGEVINLIKEKKIEIDYIKYPSISDTNLDEIKDIMTNNNINMLYHGLLLKKYGITDITSDTFIEDINIDINKEAIKISKTNGISIHIGQDKIDASMHTEEELIKIVSKNIQFLKDTFPNLEFYSFENKENTKNKIIMDSNFISKCIYLNDCNFLLDISHAAIASKNIGMDFYEYLDKLPLDKIYEIHLNGWNFDGENASSHIKITKEGYDALNYVLQYSNPKIITIEYGAFLEGKKLSYIKDFKEKNMTVRNEILEQISKVKEICR
ncbi:MAG: DUF692 family protein [Clostridia bacterium]